MKNPRGIMQGRLSPRYKGRYQAFPIDHWREEFGIAKSLGLDCIEFIFDYENCRYNPLITKKGVKEIKELVESTNVKVFSVCADYFLRFPIFDNIRVKRKKNVKTLINLIEKAATIGITDITIPCVDESSLKAEKDVELLMLSLKECLTIADQHRVNINLETDLPPDRFYRLISDLDHPRIKVNYDIGNSASFGYNPEEELNVYGKYISVLHVKDRLYQGSSVRLGTGKANFELVFKKLKQVGFDGLIVMQAARADKDSEEIAFVKEQFNFLKDCLERWFI